MPEISVNIPKIEPDSVGKPSITLDHAQVDTYKPEFEFTVEGIDDITVATEGVEVGNIVIETPEPGSNLSDVTGSMVDISKITINSIYDPRFITNPEEFTVTKVDAPAKAELPVINVNAGAFGQGAGGIMDDDSGDNGAIVENYKKYDTTNLIVDFSGNTGIGYTGNFKIDELNTISETTLLLRKELTKDAKSNTFAFISDTNAVDANISGNYTINFKEEDNNKVSDDDHVRIFVSLNPAGVGGGYTSEGKYDGKIKYNNIGETTGNYESISTASDQVKVMTLSGNVTLSNNTEKGVLVGADHQTWDRKMIENSYGYADSSNNYDGTKDTYYLNSYSVLLNTGKIILSSGNKMLGIMIDVEHSATNNLYKKVNHKTINNGEIIVEKGVSNSIAVSFEESTDEENKNYHLRDDAYLGKITLNGNNSYGLRMANIYNNKTTLDNLTTDMKNTYYDDTNIYGGGKVTYGVGPNNTSTTIEVTSDIQVNGNSNVGVSIAKSLSNNAKYVDTDGKYAYYEGGSSKSSEGGKVNPIANVHGLKITVGGIGTEKPADMPENEFNGAGNIGFLRDRDYSDNNKNDMIIGEIDGGKEAITSIDFVNGATNSVLIRSDKYGITVEKNLAVTGVLSEKDAKEFKNTVLQATASSWTDGADKKHSVGNITNEGIISGIKNTDGTINITNGLVGMMASGSLDADVEDTDIIKGSKKYSTVRNTGTIEFNGTSNIGMAVLENNIGELQGAGTGNTERAVIKVNATAASDDETEYNLGIYNEGKFDIDNALIETNGVGSMGIYNLDTDKTNQDDATVTIDNTNINVSTGAVGIYTVGGSVTSGEGLNIIADGASADNKGGIGVYAAEGAKVDLTGANINVKGTVGIASVGAGTDIQIKNSTITYDGDGYALYTDDGGITGGSKISSLQGTTLNLEGKSFGMKLDLGGTGSATKPEDQPINLEGLTINVNSNDATVFNLVHETGGNYNVTGLLDKLKENILTASGFDITTIGGSADRYKTAIVDGGKLEINGNIAQSDAADKYGFFYFKRFLGQRLDVKVGDGITVDGTMSAEHANKYFAGQMVGLEMNSSSYATSNSEAKITLNNGATVIANRLNGTDADKGAIGIYGNYGTITLNDGSKVVVEGSVNADGNVQEGATDEQLANWEKIDGTKQDTTFDEGVGIYAVNGTDVIANANSEITVHGNKAVGIYGLTYREENGNPVGAEFGANADNQGKINISNAGTIDVAYGTGTVGIYAENNNDTDKNIAGIQINRANAKVENTGTIKVGTASDTVSSVGIYGQGAEITNTGTIELGNGENNHGSIGIYADNSEIKEFGTIKLGKYSTGAIITNGGTAEGATGTLVLENNAGVTDNITIGLSYDSVGTTTDFETAKFNIDASNAAGVKALTVKNGFVEYGDTAATGNSTISINGENSRGIRVLDNGTIKVNENAVINVGKEGDTLGENQNGSIGILAMDSNGKINNLGTINVNSEKGIGIYLTNKNAKEGNENSIESMGTINLIGKNTTGVFVDNGTIDSDDFTKINNSIHFGENSENVVGVFATNSSVTLGDQTILDNKEEITDGTGAVTGTKVNGRANILVYADNKTAVTNKGKIIVSDKLNYNEDNTKTARTIGLYLDHGSSYDGIGTITAEQGAIGLFAATGTKVDLAGGKLVVDSKGVSTTGAVLQNGGTVNAAGTQIVLTNTVKDTYTGTGNTNKALGIYADGTNIEITGDTTSIKYGTDTVVDQAANLKDGSNGTGIYLVNGAKAQGGGTINVTGNGIEITGVDGKKTTSSSVALYYAGVSDNGTPQDTTDDIAAAGIENNVNLNITKGHSIGIVAANDGLVNNGSISMTGAAADKGQRIGVYASGNSFTQSGAITLGENTVGIYSVKDGQTLTLNTEITGKGSDTETLNRAVGIYSDNTGTTIKINEVTDKESINLAGRYDVGVSAKGIVNNAGSIKVTGASGTGVYLTGTNAVYNGADGTVTADRVTEETGTTAIGIYLNDGAKIETLGNLTLGKGDTGIYLGETSLDGSQFKDAVDGKGKIDISGSNEAIAIAASSGTNNDLDVKNLDITLGKGSVGIYALDSDVNISGVNIDATAEEATSDATSSTGIYLKECNLTNGQGGHNHSPYYIDNSVITIKKGVGILLGADSTGANSKDAQLDLKGTTINVDSFADEGMGTGGEKETGIGIYVQANGELLENGYYEKDSSGNLTTTARKENTYNIKDGIGVYGAKGSTLTFNNDVMNLSGYSIGAFTEGGEITFKEGAEVNFKADSENKITGSVAYALNGNITSDVDIEVGSVTGNIKTDGFIGLATNNTATGTGTGSKITNTGDMTIVGANSVGIGAFGNGTLNNTIENSGIITVSGIGGVSGKMSAGIYSESADIDNKGTINAGSNAAGILYEGKGHSIKSTGDINLIGIRGIGAYLEGTATNVELNDITAVKENPNSSVEGNLGIYMSGLTNKDGRALTATFNNITLDKNSMGIYIDKEVTQDSSISSNVIISGNEIKVGTTDAGQAVGVMVAGGSKVDLTDTKVTLGKGGTALYNNGGTVELNDIGQLSVGSGATTLNNNTTLMGTLINSNGGTVTIDKVTNNINVDGHFGIVVSSGGTVENTDADNTNNLIMTVSNKGTGIVIAENSTVNLGIDELIVQGDNLDHTAGSSETVGVYYKDSELKAGDSTIKNSVITQKGHNTVGLVLDNVKGTAERDIILGKNTDACDSIGIAVMNSNTKENVSTPNDEALLIKGMIDVAGEGNIGLGVREVNVNTIGNITLTGGTEGSFYPIGVYLTSDKAGEHYKYTGNGDLNVSGNGTGVLGENYDISYSGNVTVDGASIGIIGKGTSDKVKIELTSGSITAATTSMNTSFDKPAIGIYGENADITIGSETNKVDSVIGGKLAQGSNDMGILLRKEGDITYNGSMDIGAGGSIGIYRENGNGNITVSSGEWAVGEDSYGIISRNEADKDNGYTGTIKNAANMTLKTSAIGIYTFGNINVENSGNITVGEADGTNGSIGIYMQNNKANTLAKGTNTGTITVNHEGSVGIQAVGNVQFTNNGTIEVDNGATGVYATYGAEIINGAGASIILGDNVAGTDKDNISTGMLGKGTGTVIRNFGIIEANDGIGMSVDDGAKLYNEKGGVINVDNGIGIQGAEGFLYNSGEINLTENGSGEKEDIFKPDGAKTSGTRTNEIANETNRIIKIAENLASVGSGYVSKGGVLNSDYDLKLENPTVDITAGNGIGFVAPEISGEIKLDSNFAGTGNGYSYTVTDFSPEDNIRVNTSKLFRSEIKEGDLYVNKVDYKELAHDSNVNDMSNLYDGLDELLRVSEKDQDILKKFNQYIDGLKDVNFDSRYAEAISEFKGNIYANVQSRMQDINRSFDNSFDEMEQSYNLSKDTDKFSVIYTNGDYKNSKAGIIDYDYNIAGLMYMKEFEGLEYGNKYGYTFGFTGSKFEFEDAAGSEEKVYSLRAGAHNVKDFGNGLDMLSKVEAGYNYHDTERKMAIPDVYENDADFNSYHVSLENKFRKTLYEDYENEFGTYLGLDLEYGRFDDIKEDGVARLKVKGNDYFISKLETGFAGTGRKYLGNDWTMKLTGDVGYSYDFGKNYGENKAKLRDASEGYYSLMSEVESRGAVSGKIGVGFEKLNHLGVTLEGEVAKDFRRDEEYWKVGLRFNYKFNKEDAVTTIRNTFNLLGNHFAFDKDEVNSRDKKIISEGSRLIDKHNVKGTIIIEGHTDSFGTEKYNQNLSEKRAANVETEFRKNIQKAENIQYDTKGYGESRPIESNDTPEGRAANRRTDVKFIDKR